MCDGFRARAIWIAALLFLATATASFAQSIYTEGRALEFRTDLPWARLVFEGNERVAGVSPLRVPGPVAGDFWLNASGPAVESQRGRVRVRLDEEGSRITSYGRPSFRETFMRSALFPGYVQFRSRERGKGTFLAIAGATALGGALWAQSEFWDAEDVAFEARRQMAASGIAAERTELLRVLQDAEEDQTYAEGRRNLYLGATAAVWSLGFIEALVFSPRFDVTRVDANSLTLGMQRKTRFDAVLRSAVLPGLGQEYNGERGKAAFVALGAIAVGAWTLHEMDDYDAVVNDLTKVDRRFTAATTVDERNALFEEREVLFETVDDAFRARKIAVAAAGAFWVLGMIDAALSFGEPWGGRDVGAGGTNLGLSADPVNGRLAAQVRF